MILPDLAAGCSMADMARLRQVEDAWDAMADAGIQDSVVPVTYMNSSADIKAFCGRNGGVVCTSSNADVALEWAFEQKRPRRGAKILFLPDQHLGRNTAVLKMGIALDECVVWDPQQPGGGLTTEELQRARMILWKGHCSVHGRFTADVVDELRVKHPGINILVHPECTHEVVLKADLVGSTEFIIKTIEAAEPGTVWAIGTELNLVKRLADAHPDKTIVFLDRNVCYCSTMNRIDLPHLVWAMENLVAGNVVNQITVDPETEADALRRAAADARPARQVPPRLTATARGRRWRCRRSATTSVGAGSAYAMRSRRGHRLDDVAAVTRAMTVLHATEAATVHLAVAARSEGLTPAHVDAALYDDRAVVKQLAMRRTLFVFPRELLPAAWGSASARVGDGGGQAHRQGGRRRPASPSDGAAWLEAARAATLAAAGRRSGDRRPAARRRARARRQRRRRPPTRPTTGRPRWRRGC